MNEPRPSSPDASYRSECGLVSNPRCPNHSSHSENAFDRLFLERRTMNGLTEAEMDAIDAESEAEYLACEGHGPAERISDADAHHLASMIVQTGVSQERNSVEAFLEIVVGSADALDQVMELLDS